MRLGSRQIVSIAAAVVVLVSCAEAQSFVPRTTAARYGLSPSWMTQVGSPEVTGRLQYVNYVDGLLLVQSSRGMLTALDAETGRKLWATQIGSRSGAMSEPAANAKHVVVVNGSTMYVIDRANGDILWQNRVTGAPGAGPGVSGTHCFIPMTSGRIEGYDLALGTAQTPWNYQSTGRVLTPPVTTDKSVAWSTEKGYLYVADGAAGGIRYRLETRGKIESRPTTWGGMIFAASTDGFVYGIDEAKGTLTWKTSLAERIFAQPVAVNGRVFIVPEFGGLYCLDAAGGNVLWHAYGIGQFIATSPTRVYAADRVGGMAILDASTGATLGTMPLSLTTTKLANGKSDRIFLVDHGCVVQCLHEAQLTSPVIYTPPAPPEEEATPKPKTKPADESGESPSEAMPDDAPADEGSPFDPPADEPAAGEGSPFDAPADAPAEEPAAADENPFDP